VNAVGGESANTKHHVCRIGQCVNNLVLRWQHEKADVYARHISDNMELLAQFDEAERAGDVDKLAFCVRSLIVQAASSRAVGMSAHLGVFSSVNAVERVHWIQFGLIGSAGRSVQNSLRL
jgi:predicted dinucleotide-utilizing enzyme